MDQNRGPGNKIAKLNVLQFNKGSKNVFGKRKEEKTYSTNDTGKTEFLSAKDEISFIYFTLYKNQLKMNQRP